jgi:starch phosphorylase
MPGTRFSVEIRPVLPERLQRLEDLANDLYYSWDRGVRRLFRHLDEKTWIACRSNPKVFLRRIAQEKLEEAAHDPIFLADYRGILSSYDTYMQERPLIDVESKFDMQRDLIAYFSAEFGFHQSVPIYAGGLGILAGDYCKSMSNLWVPFVGVGLLYREGYFTQHIQCEGEQVARYPHVDPEDLPVVPAVDAAGNEITVRVDVTGRSVELKVWEVRAGHIRLFLLDSDLAQNASQDRAITAQLYGGDREVRIKQEIVLGIGGVRALRSLQLAPTVWHINEGHAGFQILERVLEQVQAGIDFDSALELVAANTVFTTHTPVPAGHDIFDANLVRDHFARFITDLGINDERFFALGADARHPSGFNMTSLSMRGSRFRNGVSRIHGRVAAEMEGYLWPQIPCVENPISHVTNGVDVESFLGQSWAALFDMYMGRGWRAKLTDSKFWQEFIGNVPDHVYQSVRHIHKNAMFAEIRRRLLVQLRRSGCSESLIRDITQYLTARSDDVLVICFARRFATYKRATLLFKDLPRLARLVNDDQRPVMFVFAGKAHPNDEPGKKLLKEIAEISLRPEFRGKVLLLEDYNLSLARDLYPGVDVWLNVPEYPKEACGTSGMKAGINGAINLSVLDGWWGEAFDGHNGWAITPHPQLDAETRDAQESAELLSILEREVIPLYFARNEDGERRAWIEKSKVSMCTIMPQFNGVRMVGDYLRELYGPAALHGRQLGADGAAGASELAQWRAKVMHAWPNVRARLADTPRQVVGSGEAMLVCVNVALNGLAPEDVQVECVIGGQDALGDFMPLSSVLLEHNGQTANDEAQYQGDLCSPRPCFTFEGLQHYQIRVYPWHRLLNHRFECGLMLWL